MSNNSFNNKDLELPEGNQSNKDISDNEINFQNVSKIINFQNISKISKVNQSKINTSNLQFKNQSFASVTNNSKYKQKFTEIEDLTIDLNDSDFLKEDCDFGSKNKEDKPKTDKNLNHILSMNKSSDEITLPGHEIYLKHLELNKPISFKGVCGTKIIVEEGPIIINSINSKPIKFSQVDFIFRPKLHHIGSFEEEIVYFLFKIYPGSILEMEMCNIMVDRNSLSEMSQNCKFVCFQVLTKMSFNNNFPNDCKKVSILKLISTKISKFDQTIRACEDSIIDIENCVIDYNIGKAIALLNPKILKISNTVFEMNLNNVIQIKYINNKTQKNKSTIYVEKTTFQKNYGCGIQIEASNNDSHFSVDLIINNSKFLKNKLGGLNIKDLNSKKLRIESSLFQENGESGVSIRTIKPIGKSSDDDEAHIIRKNVFSENEIYGLFLFGYSAIIIECDFNKNKSGGIVISTIEAIKSDFNHNQDKNKSIIDAVNKVKSNNVNKNNSNSSSLNLNSINFTVIQKCNFLKNGGSGVKIINSQTLTHISMSTFQENIEYGIYLDNEQEQSSVKIEKFKNWGEMNKHYMSTLSSNEIPADTHVLLQSCRLLLNLRSGIYLNNCFVYFKDTCVNDNIHHAFEACDQNQRNYTYFDDFSKNNVIGTFGGTWGEIALNSKINCINCFSSSTISKKVNLTKDKNDKASKKNDKQDDSQNRGHCKIF